MDNPSDQGIAKNGKIGYWDDSTDTIGIRDQITIWTVKLSFSYVRMKWI